MGDTKFTSNLAGGGDYGKARLPKLAMPSFCERSEAKAGSLGEQQITAKP